MKIVVIAGVRAQFMKLAAFQRAVKQWNVSSTPRFLPTYINSGQHYDDSLAGRFIRELDVHFDVDLTGSYQNLRPIRLLGSMIAQLYDVLAECDSPDWVIVFGDANTTLAGALAAAKLGLPVIHVEAGLRTNDLRSPEEVNRVVSDHLSSVHFASSQQDMCNLRREGLMANAIWTGDLIADLVAQLLPTIAQSLDGYRVGEYVLASIHREENVQSDELLRNALHFLNAHQRTIVFITHPRVKKRLYELELHQLKNIQYVDALPYATMLSAIRGCAFLITDSGAFQREAYYLRKRCLVRQDKPFWSSLIDAGVHRSVGVSLDEMAIGFQWIEQAILDSEYPKIEDLGDGSAGKRMLQHIVQLSLSQ